MSTVIVSQPLLAVPTGTGVIAGEGVGIVTLDNVPGVALVDLFVRNTNAWVRRTVSRDDGTYRFTGLPMGVLYDVIGRDLTDTWDDVIVGRVSPFVPVTMTGNAPGVVVGQAYSYSYIVAGGEAPYTFTLTGSLPDGLVLSTTDTSVSITGTALPGALQQTFQLDVEDARGTVVSLTDTIGVFPVGSHRYWRINITAANGHCSVAEIEMAAATGGPDQCVGGVAIESSHYPPHDSFVYGANYAFDGTVGSGSNCWASANNQSGWVGYLFADPTLVAEIRIAPRIDYGGQSPRDFTIESSDDGISWNVEATYTGRTSWTFGALTAFAV